MGAIRARQVMVSLRRRRVRWPAAVAVSALVGALAIAPEAATASTATGPTCTDTGGYRTCVYGFTGDVDSWTVPAGLTSPTVTVDLRGASGGDGRTAKGGNGAFVEVKMNLAAGDTLSFLAGSQGASFTPTQYLGSFAGVSGFRSGGFPDGGDAGLRSTNDTSAGGGGSTLLVVKRAGTAVNDFVADAAGGGGAGGDGGSGYTLTNVGAVPTGGAGGAGDAAGTVGGSSTDPSYAAATGGNAGSQGTLDAVGTGGAGVSGCVAGRGLSNPGANGVTLDLTVPTYGDGGHGGLGYTSDPRPVGDGGGGGGGYRGGGGGSAGGTCYLPAGSTSPYDYTAAGGGGAGGGSAVDSAEVVSQFSATRDTHGDGSVSITFAVGDITPPTTTIDSAPTDPTDKTDATVFFHGADTGGSGIDHFECRLDTAAFATCASPVTYTGLATGAHRFQVRAVDGNGNTDPNPATASWTFLDATPPDTRLDSVPSATIYVPSATVHFSGTDNSDPDGIARFECSLDGADFSTCTSPATFDGLSIGDHTVAVRAVDRGGNIDPTPATTSFTVSAATPPSACTVSGTSTTCTYSALDLPYRTFTVPAKVVALQVVADGARGGNDGGDGGRAVATVPVTPGEVLRIYLGGHGQSENGDCGTGGANGGGDGACLASLPGQSSSAGGGGGASDVRRAPYGLGDRLVVGAGGGGGDGDLTYAGGAGGGLEGAPGSGTLQGSGGTQSAGGAVGTQSCGGSDFPGSSGRFGLGGDGAYCPGVSGFAPLGGGGGGGWFGGGGAGSVPNGGGGGWSSGGGGSSYAVPSASNVTLTTGGGSTYDGRVQLTYAPDTVAPSVTVEQAATQADPTSASAIHFTATFSEPVTGLTASEFVVGGTAPGAAVTALTEAAPGGGTTWDVAVGGVTSAGTVTLTLPAGAVTDLAGNPSTASTSTDDTVTYQPDTTPPTTTITSAPVDPTDSSSASFSFTADDGTGSGVASSLCSLDGAAFSACSSPVGYQQLVDGSHSFRVRSVDVAGNVEDPVSYTWTVDTVAPVTSLTSTPADPSKTAAPTFAFAVDGTGSAVAGSECSLDGAAFTACSSPVAYSGLADGAHTFQVRSTDAAGNTEQPRSYQWSIDTLAPTATTTSSPPDPTADTSASVAFTTADVGSGVARVQCSLDTAAWADCTSPVSYTALPDGRHTVRVRAIDRAGNVGEPASVSWLVDTVAPTLAPTISPSPTYLGDVATVTPNATDDGSGVASASCGTPATDSAGDHSVVCTATDHAGNTTSVTFPYLVQYRISAFPSPVPDSKWKAGQTVPIKATLTDGAGTPLSDAQSEALAADCRVQFTATGAQSTLTPACMKYDTAKHQFVYPWHLAKSPTGSATLTVQVTYPGWPTSAVRTETITITG